MSEKTEQKVMIWRILEIDRMIRENNFPNCKTFMKKFEISRSTIMRDMEFLRDRYNAPLEFDYIKNGYYYTDNTFFIQNVMLQEGELFTISTILPLLEQYKNTPLENSFKSIMEKICGMLPNSVSVDSFYINNQIKFISDPLPHISQEIFNAIFKAIQIKKAVKFEYKTISSQEYSERTIEPFNVICQKGAWYAIGRNVQKNEIRVYTLSRMKNLSLLDESYTVPTDFKLEEQIDPSFGIWINKEKPFKVELLFDKDVSTLILERDWHKNQITEAKPDGSVYLSFETNQMQEVLHWVMQFCGHVKVLAPEELKRQTIDAAKLIIERAAVQD